MCLRKILITLYVFFFRMLFEIENLAIFLFTYLNLLYKYIIELYD